MSNIKLKRISKIIIIIILLATFIRIAFPIRLYKVNTFYYSVDPIFSDISVNTSRFGTGLFSSENFVHISLLLMNCVNFILLKY